MKKRELFGRKQYLKQIAVWIASLLFKWNIIFFNLILYHKVHISKIQLRLPNLFFHYIRLLARTWNYLLPSGVKFFFLCSYKDKWSSVLFYIKYKHFYRFNSAFKVIKIWELNIFNCNKLEISVLTRNYIYTYICKKMLKK